MPTRPARVAERTVADDGKHAGSFTSSFACDEFIEGAWRLQEGGFEGGSAVAGKHGEDSGRHACSMIEHLGYNRERGLVRGRARGCKRTGPF